VRHSLRTQTARESYHGGPCLTIPLPQTKGAAMPQNDNWQPVSEVAKRLREKSVKAMNDGMFEIAEAYHDKALQLEIKDWLDGKGVQE